MQQPGEHDLRPRARRCRVTRSEPLQQINATFDNINEQSVTGVDLEFGYRFDVGGGKLGFGLKYSRLLKFERVELGPDRRVP